MHKRYTCPDIENIWSEKNKYELWFDIELMVCEAHAKYGNIPKEAVEDIENIVGIVSKHGDTLMI